MQICTLASFLSSQLPKNPKDLGILMAMRQNGALQFSDRGDRSHRAYDVQRNLRPSALEEIQ